MISNNKKNSIIFLFFFIYFIVGFKIFKDFGIGIEEHFQRSSDFIAVTYLNLLISKL